MSNDVYKAPEADLSSAELINTQFFVVSIRKLWIMSFITMGAYLIVWNYHNWKNYREKVDDLSIWPVPRAIFSLFFISSLMKLISSEYEEKTKEKWSYISFVIIYIAVSIFGWVMNSFEQETIENITAQLIYLVAGAILITYSVVPAQKRINEICDDTEGKRNNELTGINILWIVLFGIYWLMVFFGTYIILTEGFA